MFLQTSYRSSFVPGFGFIRWRNLSVRQHSIPDWVIAQYIVLYIQDSHLDPLPKNQAKIIAYPDWDSEVWVNISISPLEAIEVIVF
ncbi:hypothetical protein DFH28DRAFT_877545 [Melampsora americana]|nr:hypothetical protein DFH28DRAFT_877545 [Melampsora americana]